MPTIGNINDGKFKMDPFNAQQLFYQDQQLNPTLRDEEVYYGEVDYESSPLNRKINTFAPGKSWAKSGGAHAVKQQFLTNIVEDSVRIWEIRSDGESPVTEMIYRQGELQKNVVIDEHNRQIVEFIDKEGKVILKKVQLDDVAPAGGHMGWLCTYYIYDDMGSPKVIISPMGVSKITSSWNVASIADEFCFQYYYDERRRVIIRKVPGTKPVEMVYDMRDRLVLTRDGNMKEAGDWLVSFYDVSNRLVESALYHSSARRDELQSSLNNVSNTNGTTRYEFPGIADLVVAVRDRSIYTATNSITMEDGFDTGNTETDVYIDPNLKSGTAELVVNNPLPNLDPALLQPLTYVFYDEYYLREVDRY